MNWQELCDDKNLRDLPYKIELNKKGEIEMSPVSIKHLFYQKAIIQLLETFKPDGMTLFEFPLETSKGTKVPDVVWLTKDQAELVKNEFSASSAPMICIEVLSPSTVPLRKVSCRVHAVRPWQVPSNPDARIPVR